MSKPKVLLQIDTDPHASSFDAIVALDSGVDHLLSYHGVEASQVRELVHGAMFTRGPKDLHQTAIFIGGANVALGESLLEAVTACFFGPMRVSVMMDANGANTTAAAAVLAAARHLDLRGAKVLVLASTGPVGQRVVRLLARQQAEVRAASRSRERASAVCDKVRHAVPDASLTPHDSSRPDELRAALSDADAVIAAGAAGVELLSEQQRQSAEQVRVAIDLNAVPPPGIAGIEATDTAVERDGAACYGAIGVGATKMQIHQAALGKLFEANDHVLDAEEIFEIGQKLEST